ncbi:MAG: glycosyltransferase family 9 protein [Gammaproteobacteria bacterium]|jgi:ADP-heptose:LPS heptosyltransferase|nr:glycosyltransferase family 9 protein [Gammaproteobacteria bacterium]
MQKLLSKILVIRNDKLGDFMLAWPSFQALRQLFPEARIYALVPAYTSPMAEICPWIDEVVLDENQHGLSGLIKTTSRLKAYNFDSALCLHSTPSIALALFLAGIPQRFAPASRIDQIFYNHTLTQLRSRSEKPEYEYNTELALFMGRHFGVSGSYSLNPPLLSFPDEEVEQIKNQFYAQHRIEHDRKLIFVHAGSGGSATNLSIEQYADLIHLLSDNPALFFVLTAGPSEEKLNQKLSRFIADCEHSIYHSDKGIVAFAKTLSIASVFISGSTGTLHVAGALDIPTVAFYPSRKSATAVRWQTTNKSSRRLGFSPESYSGENDMATIDIANCVDKIAALLEPSS